MFILSVGLLGLAALIPLGRFAVVETNKADYSGACGRAAMRDVEIRRFLYPYDIFTTPPTALWVDSISTGATLPERASNSVIRCMNAGAFAIDPLGMTSGVAAATGDLGVLPRVNFYVPATGVAFTKDQAQEVFLWKDDLGFTVPENSRTRRNYYDATGQLTTVLGDADAAQGPVIEGHYSWLLTATPATAEASASIDYLSRRLYKVSIAVCYRRDFDGEKSVGVTEFVGSIGYGGGTIKLDAAVDVKEGQWILLCGLANASTPAQAKWYRVVSVGEIAGSPALTLQGPDWNVDYHATPAAVVIPTVLAVYTKTIDVDNDPLWSY